MEYTVIAYDIRGVLSYLVLLGASSCMGALSHRIVRLCLGLALASLMVSIHSKDVWHCRYAAC